MNKVKSFQDDEQGIRGNNAKNSQNNHFYDMKYKCKISRIL